MSRKKILRLPSWLEFSHALPPHPYRFVRFIGAVILIYCGAYPVSIPDEQQRSSALYLSQSSSAPRHGTSINGEKALGRRCIPLYLKIDIDSYAVLIHGSPKKLPFRIDRYKNFVNAWRITIATVIQSQSACVNSAEFDAPEPDSLTTNNDPSLDQ
jgi:hypothetical protein